MAVIAPAGDLVLVQAGIYLHKAAAPAWETARALSRNAYGIDLRITSPYGGYRSLAQQWAMWWNRSTSTNGKVAFPGFSVHGSGMCVDVGNYRDLSTEQLDAAMNAGGFFRTIGNEPWHYEKRNGGASSSAPKPDQSEEDDDMTTAILYHLTTGASGTLEAYRDGKDWGDKWPDGSPKGVTHRTYNDQWFIQEAPFAPLKWIEFSGGPAAYSNGRVPTIHRTAVELRDKELTRYGHVPQPGMEPIFESLTKPA